MSKQLDTILIEDIALKCLIGIYPRERVRKQSVIINVAIHADLRKACKSDSITDTVDYKAIKKDIVKMVTNSQFMLVERLAQGIADICLADRRVRSVSVRVDKPGALRYARSVAVQIHRSSGGA